MADIRIVPALGAINVTGSADFRGDSASTVLFVSGSGNVGVGTSNPISKFHVAGAVKATATTGHVLGTSTDTGRALSILNSGLAHGESYSMALGYANSSNNQAEITYYLSATGSTSNRLSLGLYNSSDTLNVVGTGRVGVGITNPSYTLHTVGQVAIQNAEADIWMINTGGGAGTWRILGSSGNTTRRFRIYDHDNSADRFNIETNGQIKFNTYGSGTFTGTAAKTLAVDSSGNVIEINNTALDGSGTANRVAYWTDSDTLAADADFSFDGTNVGIGTTSPLTKLTVSGDANISAASSGNSYKLYFGDEVTSGPGKGMFLETYYLKLQGHRNEGIILQGVNATGSVQQFAGFYGDNNSSYPSQIHLTPTGGSVAIGHTAPSAQVHINSGGSYTNTDVNNRFIIERNSHAYMLFSSPEEYDQGFHFHNTTDNAFVGRIAYQHRATGDFLRFRVGTDSGDGQVSISSGGSVGIGTTAPTAPLEVYGQGASNYRHIYVNSNETVGAGITLQVSASNPYSLIATGPGADQGASKLLIYRDSTDGSGTTAVFDASGNVGIGLTNPSSPLHIFRSETYSANISRADWASGTPTKLALGKQYGVLGYISTDLVETINDTSYIALNYKDSLTTFAEGLRVYNTGNVGIGTLTPGAKLDVVGNARISGDLTVTGILTAREFHTTFVSASIIYQSGSTQFGNSDDDNHTFTGRVVISGSTTASPAGQLNVYAGGGAWSEGIVVNPNANGTGAIFFRATRDTVTSTWFVGHNGVEGFNIIKNGLTGSTGFRTDLTQQIKNTGETVFGFGVTAPSFTGSLQGDITGNAATATNVAYSGLTGAVPTWNQSTTGNAATATALQTARTLTIGSTGKTFDGTGNVSWTLGEIGAQAAGSYLTAEADTLATVTGRGASTSTASTFSNTLIVAGGGNTLTLVKGTGGPAIAFAGTSDEATGLIEGVSGGGLKLYSRTGSLSSPTSYDAFNIKNGGDAYFNYNVGIGTTSPAYKLEVAGELGVSYTNAISTMQGGTGYSLLRMYAGNGSSDSVVEFQIRNRADAADIATIGTYSNHDVRIRTNNTDKVTIQAGGNVGIGTTSPADKLEVSVLGYGFRHYGDASNYLRTYAGSSYQILDNGTNQFGYFSGKFYVQTSGTDKLTIDTSGNVGIGVTSPSSRLDVRPTTAVAYQGTVPYQTTTTAILSPVMNAPSADTYTSILQLVSVREALVAGRYAHGYLGFSTVDNSNITGILDAGRISIKNDDGIGAVSATSMGFWTNTGGSSSNPATERMRITSDGTLMVGTTSQTYNNTTYGYIASFKGAVTTQAYLSVALSNQTSTSQGMLFGLTSTTGDIYVLDNKPLVLYTNSTEKMRITAAGNVGIGLTNPSAKLHINPTTVDEIAIAINGTQNYSANSYQRISAGDATSLNRVAIGFGYDNTPEWTIKYSSYHTHAFFTGNDWGSSTEKLRITSAGNVGIGLTNPVAKLGVSDGTNAFYVQHDASGPYLSGANNQNTVYKRLSYDASEHLFFISAFEKMRITSDGNVGIGTTTPNAPLHIVKDLGTSTSAVARLRGSNSTARTTRLQFEDYNGTIADGLIDFIIPTAGSSTGARLDIGVDSAIMSLVKGGNVGIGTTSPGANLDIKGAADTAGLVALQLRAGNSSENFSSNQITFTYGNSQDYRHAIKTRHHSNDYVNAIDFYVWKYGTDNAGDIGTQHVMTIIQGGAASADTGRVGIGVTNPASKLHVNGFARALGFSVNETGGTVSGFVGYEKSWLGTGSSNSLAIASEGSNDIIFYTNGSTTRKMIITTGGNVGIGSTAPAARIDVTSAEQASGRVDTFKSLHTGQNTLLISHFGQSHAAAPAVNQIAAQNAEQHLHLVTDTAANVSAGTSTLGIMIRSGGNVGIGTNSVTSKLRIVGPNSSTVPIIDVVASGTGTYQRGIRLLNGGMNSGDHIMVSTGYADNARNMGQFYFYFAGNGSTSNRLSMGLHSVDDVFNIIGDGTVGIGTTATTGQVTLRSTTSGIPTLTLNHDLSSQFHGQINTYDPYHGMIFRGYPTAATTYAVTAADVISFYEYGSDFRFYKKNATPALQLDVQFLTGDGRFRGDVIAYYNFSDQRLKTDIKPLENSLEKVLKLQGVSYKWVKGVKEGVADIGLIAQQVEQVVPEVVTEKTNIDDETYKSVNYEHLVGLLIEGMKEQQTRIETLEDRISVLEQLLRQKL